MADTANMVASGSISIKRMRRGYTLQMCFENRTNVALYQGVDDAGNVAPSWSNPTGKSTDTETAKDAKRPQIRPHVEASDRSLTVTVKNGVWKYLSVELSFDSTTGKCTTSGYTEKFKLSTDGTYTLTICGDLASKDNQGNDTLTFSCDAEIKGAQEQHIEGTVDVLISPVGTSSWSGIVSVSGNTINTPDAIITLSLQLMHGTELQTSFNYAIVKAGTKPTASDIKSSTTQEKSITTVADGAINKDKVNGQTTFLVYFYQSGVTDPEKYVDCWGFSVIDTNDDYRVFYRYKDDKITQVDENNPVTLIPYIAAVTDNTKTITTATEAWTHQIYHGSEEDQSGVWEPSNTVYGTKAAPEVTISTSDTDYTDSDGNTVQKDVTVVSEVQFTLG